MKRHLKTRLSQCAGDGRQPYGGLSLNEAPKGGAADPDGNSPQQGLTAPLPAAFGGSSQQRATMPPDAGPGLVLQGPPILMAPQQGLVLRSPSPSNRGASSARVSRCDSSGESKDPRGTSGGVQCARPVPRVLLQPDSGLMGALAGARNEAIVVDDGKRPKERRVNANDMDCDVVGAGPPDNSRQPRSAFSRTRRYAGGSPEWGRVESSLEGLHRVFRVPSPTTLGTTTTTGDARICQQQQQLLQLQQQLSCLEEQQQVTHVGCVPLPRRLQQAEVERQSQQHEQPRPDMEAIPDVVRRFIDHCCDVRKGAAETGLREERSIGRLPMAAPLSWRSCSSTGYPSLSLPLINGEEMTTTTSHDEPRRVEMGDPRSAFSRHPHKARSQQQQQHHQEQLSLSSDNNDDPALQNYGDILRARAMMTAQYAHDSRELSNYSRLSCQQQRGSRGTGNKRTRRDTGTAATGPNLLNKSTTTTTTTAAATTTTSVSSPFTAKFLKAAAPVGAAARGGLTSYNILTAYPVSICSPQNPALLSASGLGPPAPNPYLADGLRDYSLASPNTNRLVVHNDADGRVRATSKERQHQALIRQVSPSAGRLLLQHSAAPSQWASLNGSATGPFNANNNSAVECDRVYSTSTGDDSNPFSTNRNTTTVVNNNDGDDDDKCDSGKIDVDKNNNNHHNDSRNDIDNNYEANRKTIESDVAPTEINSNSCSGTNAKPPQSLNVNAQEQLSLWYLQMKERHPDIESTLRHLHNQQSGGQQLLQQGHDGRQLQQQQQQQQQQHRVSKSESRCGERELENRQQQERQLKAFEQQLIQQQQQQYQRRQQLAPIGMDGVNGVVPSLQLPSQTSLAVLEMLRGYMQPEEPVVRNDNPPGESTELEAWERIPPNQWDTNQVIGWILSVGRRYQIDVENFNIYRFADITGDALTTLSLSDFKDRDSAYGPLLYAEFRAVLAKLRAGNSSCRLSPSAVSSQDIRPSTNTEPYFNAAVSNQPMYPPHFQTWLHNAALTVSNIQQQQQQLQQQQQQQQQHLQQQQPQMQQLLLEQQQQAHHRMSSAASGVSSSTTTTTPAAAATTHKVSPNPTSRNPLSLVEGGEGAPQQLPRMTCDCGGQIHWLGPPPTMKGLSPSALNGYPPPAESEFPLLAAYCSRCNKIARYNNNNSNNNQNRTPQDGEPRKPDAATSTAIGGKRRPDEAPAQSLEQLAQMATFTRKPSDTNNVTVGDSASLNDGHQQQQPRSNQTATAAGSTEVSQSVQQCADVLLSLSSLNRLTLPLEKCHPPPTDDVPRRFDERERQGGLLMVDDAPTPPAFARPAAQSEASDTSGAGAAGPKPGTLMFGHQNDVPTSPLKGRMPVYRPVPVALGQFNNTLGNVLNIVSQQQPAQWASAYPSGLNTTSHMTTGPFSSPGVVVCGQRSPQSARVLSECRPIPPSQYPHLPLSGGILPSLNSGGTGFDWGSPPRLMKGTGGSAGQCASSSVAAGLDCSTIAGERRVGVVGALYDDVTSGKAAAPYLHDPPLNAGRRRAGESVHNGRNNNDATRVIGDGGGNGGRGSRSSGNDGGDRRRHSTWAGCRDDDSTGTHRQRTDVDVDCCDTGGRAVTFNNVIRGGASDNTTTRSDVDAHHTGGGTAQWPTHGGRERRPGAGGHADGESGTGTGGDHGRRDSVSVRFNGLDGGTTVPQVKIEITTPDHVDHHNMTTHHPPTADNNHVHAGRHATIPPLKLLAPSPTGRSGAGASPNPAMAGSDHSRTPGADRPSPAMTSPTSSLNHTGSSANTSIVGGQRSPCSSNSNNNNGDGGGKWGLGSSPGPGGSVGGRAAGKNAEPTVAPDAVADPSVKPKKTRKRSEHVRGNKLWEFIRDALKNPESCPSVVRWEDPAEGVFRIADSEKLAKLWGEKKNNQKMTYEKLSRAMRTYYEKLILVPVPKTGLYPKKLVYKFGPRATNLHGPIEPKLPPPARSKLAATKRKLAANAAAAAVTPASEKDPPPPGPPASEDEPPVKCSKAIVNMMDKRSCKFEPNDNSKNNSNIKEDDSITNNQETQNDNYNNRSKGMTSSSSDDDVKFSGTKVKIEPGESGEENVTTDRRPGGNPLQLQDAGDIGDSHQFGDTNAANRRSDGVDCADARRHSDSETGDRDGDGDDNDNDDNNHDDAADDDDDDAHGDVDFENE